MSEITIATLPEPSGFSPDPLTDVIRDGVRKLIEQAIEAELAALMSNFAADRLEDGRARLVRHGYLPEREVLTGVGPVPVKVPRVRDRRAREDRITFTPSILPRYLRKAKSVEDLLPWLILKGVSTGDFSEALAAFLGPNAKGLSAKTVTRLKADWFMPLADAHEKSEDWPLPANACIRLPGKGRHDNEDRPHSAIGYNVPIAMQYPDDLASPSS